MAARKTRSRARRKKRTGCCLRNLAFFVLVAAFGIAAFLLVSGGCGRKSPSSVSVAKGPTAAHHRVEPSRDEAEKDSEPSRDEDTSRHAAAGKNDEEERKAETPGKIEPNPPSPPILKSHRFLTDFSRGDENSPKIALTFDAGASAVPCGKILDVLAKHNVHATFFLTGKWIVANPQLVRRIAEDGHEIGNHTYSHRRLTKLMRGDIALEVEKTERLVEKETGRSTKPLLRVPYGDRNRRVLSVLVGLGYRSIYWDLDSWDSVKEGITSSEIEKRVIDRVRNGSIVLMHCGSQATADSLDRLLDRLTSSGYQPVKVSELIQR